MSLADRGIKRTFVAPLERCIVGLTCAFDVSSEGFQRLGGGACSVGDWAGPYCGDESSQSDITC